MQRRLAAILSADAEGYSRLMGEDEAATVRTLTAYRELMREAIGASRGRIVDTPGDNVLAEFGSVVDAVECAVSIQDTLRRHNAELPTGRRLHFRIGINVGDVLTEGDRIYGDGVNVAARLEKIAEPGGICLSGAAYDEVERKLPFRYEALGEQRVKNIARPVRVYRVSTTEPTSRGEPVEIADAGASSVFRRPGDVALALPDRPSIVVLPFANIGRDPAQEALADGMTEDIITTLSKISGLFVIAGNSAFTYKGRAVNVPDVARQLGVRHVLKGSVRRSGNRARVTAQLIDGATGYHVWADRFDCELPNLFDVQDQITQRIVTELEVVLTEGEQARRRRRATSSVEAFERWARGMAAFRDNSREGNARARAAFEAAVAIDPHFALAIALIGFTHCNDIYFAYQEDRTSVAAAAEASARAVLALDPDLPEAHHLLAAVHLMRGDQEKAVAAAKRGIELDPNAADLHAYLAFVYNRVGRAEEALAHATKAMRLSPAHPAWYLTQAGYAYMTLERWDEALAAYRAAASDMPDNWLVRVALVTCYMALGHEPEARQALAAWQARDPKASMERVREFFARAGPAGRERMLDLLARAGLT